MTLQYSHTKNYKRLQAIKNYKQQNINKNSFKVDLCILNTKVTSMSFKKKIRKKRRKVTKNLNSEANSKFLNCKSITVLGEKPFPYSIYKAHLR